MIARWRTLSWIEIGAVVLIILLAAVLRFGWLGVNSYAGDEARISLDALRLTRGGEFVYVAQPSSTGIPFLPASVWMFAPPYWLSSDPLVATNYVALLSLLTVIGAWTLARHWGTWAGLATALYLAASPYAVFYGRNIWQPDLLPILGLAWAWAGLRGALAQGRGQRFGVGLNVFLGLFVVQVHFAGAALALGTVYLFVRFRWWQKRHLAAVIVCAALALLCTLPYLYYVSTQAPELLDRLRDVGSGAAVIDLSAARNMLHLALGFDWGYLALGDFDTVSQGLTTAVLAGLLVGLGILALVRIRIADSRSAPEADSAHQSMIRAEIVLLWLVISPLFFLRHTTPVLPHYQLIALPALALAAGAATMLISARAWRVGITLVTVVLALVWTNQIAASLNSAAVERPPQSALSSILRESRDAAAGLTADRAAIFFAHGDDPAINGEVAVFRTLLWDHPDARIVNGEATLILPSEPATLMATLSALQAWEEIEASGLASVVEIYPRRAPAEAFVSTIYDGVYAPDGFTSVEPVTLADDAVLEGWRIRQVGARLRVSTLWRIEQTSMQQATIQQFHHLYTGEVGGSPDFVSDVPLSVHQWRTGDRVIVMGDFIDLPAGDYQLIVGHYTLPDVSRIARADGSDGAVLLGVINAE
ncbi:MAG: hypothetical protein KJ065_23885 [Anaerolineae bacterium]|nr:hypothetical protein [Anaerolineae bacterium]